jgi:hypothetical protein
MNCKKVYIGQEITQEDWDYGIGSVYLAGPRNLKGKSWRIDLIQKIEISYANLLELQFRKTKNPNRKIQRLSSTGSRGVSARNAKIFTPTPNQIWTTARWCATVVGTLG